MGRRGIFMFYLLCSLRSQSPLSKQNNTIQLFPNLTIKLHSNTLFPLILFEATCLDFSAWKCNICQKETSCLALKPVAFCVCVNTAEVDIAQKHPKHLAELEVSSPHRPAATLIPTLLKNKSTHTRATCMRAHTSAFPSPN